MASVETLSLCDGIGRGVVFSMYIRDAAGYVRRMVRLSIILMTVVTLSPLYGRLKYTLKRGTVFTATFGRCLHYSSIKREGQPLCLRVLRKNSISFSSVFRACFPRSIIKCTHQCTLICDWGEAFEIDVLRFSCVFAMNKPLNGTLIL